MILVEIHVSAMNRAYDFQLDENADIGSVIDELAELIARKEQCRLESVGERFSLCSREAERVLPEDRTLWACNIRTGSRLILV